MRRSTVGRRIVIGPSAPLRRRIDRDCGRGLRRHAVNRAEPRKKAVERSRKTVKMLDNIFKQTIGLVTGKPMLRALTPVPVVMQKCLMCHAHYADAKDGEPIGAIIYTVPRE